LSFEGGQWILQDVGSQNGTYVGYDRVQRTAVGPGAQIHLGHPVQGTLIRFSAAPGAQAAPQPHGSAPLQQAPPPQGPPPSRYANQPQQGGFQQYGGNQPAPPPSGPQYQQPQQRPAAAQSSQPQYQQYQQPPQQPPAQPARPLSAQPPQPPQQRPPGYVETMVAGPGHGSGARPQVPQQGRPSGYVETMVAGRSGAAAPPRPPQQQQQNRQDGLNAYQQTFGAIPQNPGLMTLVGKQSPKTVKPVAGGRTVKIGRAADNDIVVDNDLRVSNYHAELRSSGGRYEIVDVGSRNGTFVNGQRVERAAIGPQDIVGIGRSTFHLQGDVLMQFVDNGAVSLVVRELAVIVDGGKKTLLDHVSFPVGEKMLLAVIGPSGAGKSTLLKALTGLRPADQGTVYYDGRDLYRDYAELRSRIGLVPQDDVLHTQLTVRRALIYAAELRFPDDTHAKEREARVDEVLAELGLTERAKLRISALSGGQRKRVSVALELLTKPSLLFLDEPTSGLDPGLDKSVMQMLRGLADDGRTVITVTHSVANLDLCDRLLVLAPGGKIAFYGPPEQALPFLGFDDWADVFQAFDDPSRDWGGNYKRSKAHQQYVETGMIAPVPAPQQGFNAAPPAKAQSWPEQLSTLLRRYVRTIASDPMFLAITVALPIIMGLLARVVPTGKLIPKPGDLPGHNGNAANLLLILCIGGVLTGAANAVRELVKERTIYQRERAVGLSRSAYLASKLIVLGVITAGQAVVLTFVAMLGVKVPTKGVFTAPMLEIMVAVVMLSFTAMTLGLLISAIVKTSEMTMPLLVLVTLVQVVFCGALVQLHGKVGLEEISWLVPSRWAFAAMAGSIDATFLIPNGSHPGTRINEPLWKQSFGIWFLDLLMLAVITVVFAFLVARSLRRHEPEVMRGR
jgi:ABC-type multidrug transport system ATPase subunit